MKMYVSYLLILFPLFSYPMEGKRNVGGSARRNRSSSLSFLRGIRDKLRPGSGPSSSGAIASYSPSVDTLPQPQSETQPNRVLTLYDLAFYDRQGALIEAHNAKFEEQQKKIKDIKERLKKIEARQINCDRIAIAVAGAASISLFLQLYQILL